MKQRNTYTTADRTFMNLCEEIDFWKEQAEMYKSKYEEEVARSFAELNERLEESKKGVANALLFALSATDDEHGNLVISSENRKTLAESWQ